MVERFEEMEFSLDGEGGDKRVENVPTFQYLGIPLDQTDNDWKAVFNGRGNHPGCRKFSTGRWWRRFYYMGQRRGSRRSQQQRG